MIFHQINQLASTTRSNQHYQQPTGTNPRLREKNWIQEMNQGLRIDGDDDGDDFPLPEDVSPAEQLRQSPRLVLPRFRLETAAIHPESLLLIFSRAKDLIQQKMGTGGLPGGPRGRGRAPTLVDGGWPPSGISSAQYFLLIAKMSFVEFQDFWSCAEQVSNICSFSSLEFQLPAFPLFM